MKRLNAVFFLIFSFMFTQSAFAVVPDPATKMDEALAAMDVLLEKIMTWGWATALVVTGAFIAWRMIRKVPNKVI